MRHSIEEAIEATIDSILESKDLATCDDIESKINDITLDEIDSNGKVDTLEAAVESLEHDVAELQKTSTAFNVDADLLARVVKIERTLVSFAKLNEFLESLFNKKETEDVKPGSPDTDVIPF